MTAPDQCCRNVKKFLPGRRPHVTLSAVPSLATLFGWSLTAGDIDFKPGWMATFAEPPSSPMMFSTAGTMRFGNQPLRRGVCIGALRLTGLFPK